MAAATNVAGQLVQSFGQKLAKANGLTHVFPSPENLAGARCDRMPMPTKRAETIRALARAVCDGQVRFDSFTNVEQFLESLCEIPGIGKWTAQYIAMRALGEPDAFPSGDLGLQRALALNTAKELEQRAESWRPWRAYATVYLWNGAHHN